MSSSGGSGLSYAYWNVPPLVNIMDNLQSPNRDGVLVNTLNHLINLCCEHGTKLGTGFRANNPRDLEMTPENVSFVFPIRKSSLRLQADVHGSELFLPVMESPGFAYLLATGDQSHSTQNSLGLIDLFASMWPVLCILLLSCGIAAIVIWALECRKNTKEFPRPFLRGFSEGLWWAFVTATTVGYGDRTPRFLLSRVFGVIWILTGAGLMALFTASLTTSINLSANDIGISYGTHVAVLNGTEEMLYAIAKGAKVKVYNNLRDLVAFSTDSVPGNGRMLVDHLQLFSIIQQISLSGVKVVSEKAFPTMYGIVVRDLPSSVKECMSKTVEKMRFQAFVDMDELRVDKAWDSTILAKDRFLQIIAVDNAILGYSALGFALVFMALLLWDVFRWKLGKTRKKHELSNGDQKNPPGKEQPV